MKHLLSSTENNCLFINIFMFFKLSNVDVLTVSQLMAAVCCAIMKTLRHTMTFPWMNFSPGRKISLQKISHWITFLFLLHPLHLTQFPWMKTLYFLVYIFQMFILQFYHFMDTTTIVLCNKQNTFNCLSSYFNPKTKQHKLKWWNSH